jgi:hypothetical protein
MAKLLEVHENIQQLWSWEESQATAQPQEKTQRPPAQKEGEETMQFVIQGRETFMITRQMIRFDQEMMQKPLEEVEQVEMVMAHIPTKALYGLHASVMQEVQSRAHADATNLEVGRGVTEMLQITCDQLTVEKEEEKECTQTRLEQGLTTMYNRIPNNAQAAERSAEEKINLIAQTIDQYRQEIEELKEKLNPTTPPEVREQRKEEAALQMVEWRNKQAQ